jgi:hypothetical protein
VGFVKYPFSSSFLDSGFLSVSYNQKSSAGHTTRLVTTHVNEFLESRVGTFLLLKFVLSEQLVTTVLDKWLELRYPLEEDVSDSFNDRLLFLPFRQLLREDLVDGENVMDIPEDLLHKLVPPFERHDLGRA